MKVDIVQLAAVAAYLGATFISMDKDITQELLIKELKKKKKKKPEPEIFQLQKMLKLKYDT